MFVSDRGPGFVIPSLKSMPRCKRMQATAGTPSISEAGLAICLPHMVPWRTWRTGLEQVARWIDSHDVEPVNQCEGGICRESALFRVSYFWPHLSLADLNIQTVVMPNPTSVLGSASANRAVPLWFPSRLFLVMAMAGALNQSQLLNCVRSQSFLTRHDAAKTPTID